MVLPAQVHASSTPCDCLSPSLYFKGYSGKNISSYYDNKGSEFHLGRRMGLGKFCGPGWELDQAGSHHRAGWVLRISSQGFQEENRESGLGVVASVKPTGGRLRQDNYYRLKAGLDFNGVRLCPKQ